MLKIKWQGNFYEVPEEDLSFYPGYELATEEELKPDFQTPTTPGAVVEETAAPDMDSKLEDGSLVSQDEFDASAELDTAGDLFKANLKRAAANLAEFPAFVNRLKFALGKALPEKFGGLTEEQRKKLDELTPEQQDAYAQALGGIATPGAPDIGGLSRKGQEVGAKLRAEAEELEKNLIQYDSDITDTIFKEGNITEGTTRLLTQVIGTLPSVMQAFIPGVGIPSIVAGSAAEASREAVYEKGKDITLGQQAYATGIGASEGLLEIVTKRIGGAAFKNLIGKPKEIVKKTLLQTGTGIVKAGGAEGLSETGTLAINKFLESQYYDNAGKLIMSEQRWNEFWDEAGDTFLIGMATGKSIAGTGAGASIVRNTVGDRSVRKTLEKTNVKEVSEAFKNENITEDAINLSRNIFSERKLNEELNTKVNNGEITFNESNEIKLNFANAQAAIKLADNIKIAPSLINETVNLIQERNKLSDTVKQAGENKALVSEEANRLKEIDTRLAEISKENISIKLEEKIEKLEKPIKPPGSLMADPLGVITAADKIRQVKLEEAKQQKISNEVQDIYDKKGVEGALEIIEKFKPIVNKLVDKRRDSPNFDRELLTSEIEIGLISEKPDPKTGEYKQRSILGLIREYGPYVEKQKADNKPIAPLAGFINKQLPKRMIEASNKILGEQFTEDITEIKESRVELDDATQEVLDFVRTEPEAKEQLRDVVGITKEAAQEDAKQILKGKLPGILEKTGRDKNQILTEINKASKLKIADAVLEEMGGNFTDKQEQKSQFITFMDTNFDAVINAIPNASKNKLPLFEPQQVRRETTTEGDAAGKGVFEYKDVSRDEFIEYYTEIDPTKNPASEMNKLRAKKKGLADILAQEIGKDAIAEVLQDPTVQKEFLERQELLGKEIPKDAIPRLLQRIDRVIEKLEKPIRPKGALTADFGVFVAEAAREIALAIAKGIRAALKKGISFAKAKRQVVEEASKDLNLDSNLQKQFVKEVSSGIKIEDVLTNKFEKTVEKVYAKVTTKRFEGAMDIQIKNLKKKLNSLKTKKAKQNLLKRFFENISQTFQKPVENKLWKGSGARPAYNYYKQQLGIDLKDLGFTLVKSGRGESIAFENKPIFAPVGRPSTHKGYGSKKPYTYKFYENIVDDMDSRAESSKAYLLSEISSLLDNDGKQAVLDFISIQNFYSDSPLRLVGKLNKYEKGKGALVYEHTPPIKSLQKSIYDILNSTDNKRQILNKIKKVFESSKVDLILKTSEQKLNALGRKTSGEGNIRYTGVIKPENLIEFKRNNERAIEKYNSKDLNKNFNNFLEKSTGISAKKVFSRAKAEARGKRVKKSFGDYFVPPGAEDFAGLMHKTLAKGKEGEKQLKFYQDNLYTPYNVANENITRERRAIFEDFRALKSNLSNVPKKLKKLTSGGDFTYDQAVRVYIWGRQGNKIPGLSKTDAKELINEVKNDKELLQFADELLNITKGDGYAEPDNNWMGGNIATDLVGLMNSTKRSKHLEVWQNNVDQIFSEENLNKLEAAYGKKWVTNLNKTLERMKTGMNRKWGGDKVLQSYLDWVNGSVGAIMFLNTRSAVLQTISNINYLNFSDNNPLQAAKAFANQKQYWKDFKTIFNSDYLQERRGGNKINVNESELALAAEKGGIQGAVSLLLNKGFIFTKIADSFAIASGGATMYRNRINKYIKDGLSEKEATEKAFIDFKAITEETQQSSRPDRISEQQASNAGRLFLAFANTPMQYNRIIKKNAQDLIAGRGNRMEKVSKIIYYSTIQNLIFNAMQKALFALALGEDEDEEEEIEKYSNIANGMADSLLRGSGLTGNAVAAIKNVAVDIANRMDKPRPNFQDAAWKAATLSPPINNKLTKIRGAGYSLEYVTPKNIFEPKLDNPALSAGANIISATTNIPLDRAIRKAQNIEAAMSDEAEWWQSTALLMGWGSWELGMEDKKEAKKRTKKVKVYAKGTFK